MRDKVFNNQNGQLMNNVKVKKSELLDILMENSIKHTNDVREALELRREEMNDYFTHQLSALQGESQYDPKENINFPMPVNSIADYKKAVKMVEMTQDEIIELSEDQFDKLVMDNWGWKGQLATTSAFYGKAI